MSVNPHAHTSARTGAKTPFFQETQKKSSHLIREIADLRTKVQNYTCCISRMTISEKNVRGLLLQRQADISSFRLEISHLKQNIDTLKKSIRIHEQDSDALKKRYHFVLCIAMILGLILSGKNLKTHSPQFVRYLLRFSLVVIPIGYLLFKKQLSIIVSD